jgi:sec-independent protein translocase protein TatA
MTTGLLAPSHLILLALVALLVFGPKRLPEIGRSLGHGLRGFKESVSGDKTEADADADADTESVPVAAESRALPRPQLEQPAAQQPVTVERNEQQVA